MVKLVDPIALLKQKMQHREVASTPASDAGVPYEISMSPTPGAKLMRMTIASTYRTPIPVVFDPATRTTFPLTTES
jgi:hypothetical protein